jgi:hypothetical protein
MFLLNVNFSIKYSFVISFKIECIILINCFTCKSFWFHLEKFVDWSFKISFQFSRGKFEIFNLVEWFLLILSILSSSLVFLIEFNVSWWNIRFNFHNNRRWCSKYIENFSRCDVLQFLKLVWKLFLTFSSNFWIVLCYCICTRHIQFKTRHRW